MYAQNVALQRGIFYNVIGTTLLVRAFYLVQTVDKFFEVASRSRLSMDDILQLMDDDAFGLDSGDESDF